MTNIDTILHALKAVRVSAMPEEYDIHALIADALRGSGLPVVHEFKLGPRCRIDFMVDRVGLEIKKGRPARSDLIRQLNRYLAFDQIDAVIVITQQSVALPAQINEKPVFCCPLNRLWGVALP